MSLIRLPRFRVQQCKSRGNIPSIHGLWPNWYLFVHDSAARLSHFRAKREFFCKKVDFDISLLEPLKEELDQYWTCVRDFELPVFDSGTSLLVMSLFQPGYPMTEPEFYAHEYTKHGSCTPFNEFEYFRFALDLFKKYRSSFALFFENCLLDMERR